VSFLNLIQRSALYFWRTNLAVTLGVAAAVSVLAGALVVGDSVRGSLRELAVGRLGRTDNVLTSASIFREEVSDRARGALDASASAPLIVADGFVTVESSGRRASNVIVYGVDERFWTFHGLPSLDGVVISPALASEVGAKDGDVLLTRLQKPSAIPVESLFGRKEDVGRTVRLTLTSVLPSDRLGEFAVKPQQAGVRAVFAPLRRIQRDLGVSGQVNTVLLAGGQRTDTALRAALQVEDLGVRLTTISDPPAIVVEGVSGIVSDALESAVRSVAGQLRTEPVPVFTYLANTIRNGDRQIPYSLITATNLDLLPAGVNVSRGMQHPTATSRSSTSQLAPAASARRATLRVVQTASVQTAAVAAINVSFSPGWRGPTPAGFRLGASRLAQATGAIVLNEWAARELAARPGDRIDLEYYLWDPIKGLTTEHASFTLDRVVPIEGLAADRHLAPEYPGITESKSLADWDPPFPIDLSRVRPADEHYWTDYRTTPKAFIPYERGRDLWRSRYGALTSMRFPIGAGTDPRAVVEALRSGLRTSLSPQAMGVTLYPARAAALSAAQGATDFGEYFTYFSFFIVVSALMLAVLFFKLGVEQRLKQIGILRASGYAMAHVRRLLVSEAMVLATIGGLLGIAGAIAYGQLIVYGLTTWWVGAVGTTALRLHVTGASLAIGAVGGIAVSILCVIVSLRSVGKVAPRTLLTAQSLDVTSTLDARRVRRRRVIAAAFAIVAAALLVWGVTSPAAQAGAFFGAGALLLIATLVSLATWLRAHDARPIAGRGPRAVVRLGFRSAAFRPARSVLSAALIASAAFIIVSVGAFRREGGELTADPKSGTGGFVLFAESELPLLHNPNDPAGREALMIQAPEVSAARFTRFRVRHGEDASCLNLYKPTNPTIIAPEPGFIESNRFAFASTIESSGAERANPWLLLNRQFTDGSVPVIADATSMQYVLHVGVGDTFSIDTGGASPLVLRFVGALSDSVLQGELVISEPQFVRLFPQQQGYRLFLIDAPSREPGRQALADAEALAGSIERELQPFGVDATVTSERLAAFHRVENTYLSTFQALGGLGLLLGTIGLATVMFRNVLERRRELALLRAVGYNARHISTMITAEAAFLVIAGVLGGTLCAAIAVAPAWFGHGGTLPGLGLGGFLAAVIIVGLVSSVVATRAALRGRVLDGLRAD
jgi:putative ABC transport system permease protein